MDTNATSRAEKNLVKKYPLLGFFILAYFFFFLALLIIGGITRVVSISPTFLNTLVVFAAWTPNLAALFVTGANSGKEGIKNLIAGWSKWRVNAGWYLFGLAPIVIAFASARPYVLYGGPAFGRGTGITGATLLSMAIFHILQGATGEELGWRGYALPRLQRRYSTLTSALMLGLGVAGWHSILHLVSPIGVPEWQFWLIMVCYSVLVTWAYNNSGDSLLIATLFHFAFNFGLELVTSRLGWLPLKALFGIYVWVYLILAISVILLTRHQKITQSPRETVLR